MKTVRNIALGLAAAGALAFGTTHAQEAKKPEPQVKPGQRMKMGRTHNMGAMKNCPHETMQERRGPALEGPAEHSH